eukprot:m.789701 g.789701  ORF g.789701 m.789701 type:complete len:419 (+) comp23324_c0_seq11:324-1580(+)
MWSIRFVVLSVLSVFAPLTAEATAVLRHGWDTVADMVFMHGGNKSVISRDALEFAASHYKMVAFSNCYGVDGGGTLQEEAALLSAQEMRKMNPDIKNVFYWKGDLYSQIKGCSTAGAEFVQHPEWILRDDHGKEAGRGEINSRDPSFREFYINHIVTLFKSMDATNKSKPLLDILYLDGLGDSSPRPVKGLSMQEAEAYHNATHEMLSELNKQLEALGKGQFVLVNGLDTTANIPWQASVGPGSMVDHFGILQFINKSTGKWLPADMHDVMFNVARAPENMHRTMQIKTWPGPIVKQRDIWFNNTQPTTPSDFQKQGATYANSALATFLLIAEDNFWMGYSWFWKAHDFVPFGEDCTCPDNWYPEFNCPLGAPLGPPQDKGNYQYTREYEHASIFVDLNDDILKSRVSWHADTALCPK